MARKRKTSKSQGGLDQQDKDLLIAMLVVIVAIAASAAYALWSKFS